MSFPLQSLSILGCLAALASGQQCDVAGECIGTFLGFTSTNSTAECLVQCKESQECSWFTHNKPDSFCAIYETCDSIDTSLCPECISGQRSCLVCELPGICQGELVHEDVAGTLAMCEVQCQELSSCNFYTYDKENEHCILFSTCPELSEQESEGCTTSEVGCLVNNGTETKAQLLMVFGGEPYSNDVTLLSLDGDPPVPECLQNLNPHPKQLSGSCAATLGNSKLPHVCGGSYSECGDLTCNEDESDECYRYNPDLDSWTLSGIMSSSTNDYTACTVNGVPEMIMNGGYSGSSSVSRSTRYTSDGELFGNLPPMPMGFLRHCVVALDGDDLFVTGGITSSGRSGKSFLYHSDTMEWEVLQDIPTPRNDMACAMVHNSAGEQEIIAAGGDYVETVEIYNLQSGQWRTGNPFPDNGIFDATVVPLEESFLLVGGYDGYPLTLDTIYKYNKDNDTWSLLETRLPSPAEKPIALLVDIDIFPSC